MIRDTDDDFSPAALHLDTRSLSQEAYDHIKRLILSGAFREGEKIPEERIAQILKVSRTPIREALRQLGQYGLVVIKPRSYAKVASVSPEEAIQVAQVRAELEKMAARTLVRSASKKDMASLTRIAKKMCSRLEAGQVAEALMLDGAFHLELVWRSGNSILYEVLERLDAKTQLIRVRTAARQSRETLGAVLREHQVILEHFAAGDEEALLRVLEHHIVVSENAVSDDAVSGNAVTDNLSLGGGGASTSMGGEGAASVSDN